MNKKIILIITTVIALISITIYSLSVIKHNRQEEFKRQEEERLQQELNSIKNSYNQFVKTKTDAILYIKEKDNYIQAGRISKNVTLELVLYDNLDVNEHQYFKLKNLDFYIKYGDVEKAEEPVIDKFYENYIVFNENVVSNKFYINENEYFEFEEEFSLPIVIKDEDKIYAVLDDKLVYAMKNESSIVESLNTSEETASGVAVLNYHYVISREANEHLECVQIICHTDTQFDQHMNYIADNGFYTVTMNDLEMYIDGKIRLPKKSVAITIDDGWYVARAIEILEKHQVHATLFLIGSLAPVSAYASDYLEIHSHTWDLHTPGICAGGQGAPIKCLDRTTILNDLKKSRESLNNTTVFCWPFYEYNSYAISLVKEAGFTMAFGGAYAKATPGIDKYTIPRYVIHNTTSVDYIARMIN